MTIAGIGIATILIIAVALGLAFTLARRAMRLVVRLALGAILLLVLLVGGLIGWWHYGSGSSPSQPKEDRPRSTRRATSR